MGLPNLPSVKKFLVAQKKMKPFPARKSAYWEKSPGSQ
jgi:hypothetical protein